MNEKPVDLSSISIFADQVAWDAKVRDTLSRVEPMLAERATSADVFDHLAIWTRPALTLAAVLSLIAIPVILMEPRSIDPGTGADGMANVTRIWSAGGPPPNGAQIIGVLERKVP